ncbi:sulfate ABC transporter substrate-binding protein [Paenibacillus terrigena]|uniref:sulfate ABC transporter substrate-binding protein n=1 Tax=Paenibacillus terrigena TaxID=369333 RepID=UPI0028D728B1|nr:sulfate ABC transporter substrate-binding protein [Paenibacillus terrigena]
MRSKRLRSALALVLMICLLSVSMTACGGASQPSASTAGASDSQPKTSSKGQEVTLVIGAYSVVKDALQDILPKFQSYWLAKTGQRVEFQESYEASGTQARAIVGGFEADVTLLAMEGDIDKLTKASLITHEWKKKANQGMITDSIVVLGTRSGNPLGIKDWEDLMKPGVKVLYPNPKTSGGAQWDINAIYGAGLKVSEAKGVKDPAFAKQYLERVHQNIESLDKSGRASMAAFEYGVGDVIVTYENELFARIQQGKKYDIVVPSNTIRIENPAAVVDKNVDKHGTREVAEAFIDYLVQDEAQKAFADAGFRPVNPKVYATVKDRYATPQGLFDIQYLGGWKEVREKLYSKRGVWYQVLAGI